MNRPRKPPLYRRIAFKVALLVALLLGAGLIFRESLLKVSVQAFEGIFGKAPDPLAEFTDYSAFYPDYEDEEDIIQGGEELPMLYDLMHTGVDLGLIGHAIPNALELSDDGVWLPNPDVIKSLEEEYMRMGQGFAWLDPDRRVLAASENLGFQPGDHLPPGFAYPPAAYDIDVAHPAAWSISCPIDEGSERLGWVELVQLYAPGDYSGLEDDEADYMAAIEEQERRTQMFQRAGLAVVGGVIVLLLAGAISRLVTRRLSRLALEASAPLDGEGGLPGPFDDRGHDEISTLAGALNNMRNRVTDLLGRMDQRDADRRRFIAQVSHDLRTPLTALVACLDGASLQLEKQDLDLEELRSVLRKRIGLAHTDADRVSALADDLLEVARMDMDDPLDLEPVPPGELIRHALAVIQSLADQRGLSIQLDLPRGLPTLQADGRRLLRAIENLLRNAVEHASQQIHLLATVDGEQMTIEVRDDGPGLPMTSDGEVDMNEAKRIRSRADSAGLGLALARRVAEAHGGQLTARNLPESGAAVGLLLPVASEAAEAASPED